MSKVSQAHDTIFKNVFTTRKNALSLLGNFLPADILNRLDLKEMVYEKDTFVQKHLKAYYSDLLISIPLLDSDQDVEVELKSLLMLWKHAYRPNFFEVVRDVYRMLNQAYPGMEPKDFLIALAQYLYLTRNKDEYQVITEIVKQESKGGINMETIADMLEQRGEDRGFILGEQQGMAKGKLKATQETLIEQAAELYGPLPDMLSVKIKSIQSMENLRALARKIIRTESLDEFTELVNRAANN
ncbi:MAG: Rpn family recombination-promoting nuclease/putative transposase [Desulfonatronovibrionaceae bacterium]